MVRVRDALPRAADGTLDADAWLAVTLSEHPEFGALRPAVALLQGLSDAEYLEAGIDLTQLLLELRLDVHALLAGLLYRAWRMRRLPQGQIQAVVGADGLALLRGVERLGRAGALPLTDDPVLTSSDEDQIGNVRQLLETLIDDARVALIKLAERVVVLRLAKQRPGLQRERVAQESLVLFAPLAGRLGLWRLKWAMEDLAFRYLEPDVYQQIARQLDGRRQERERDVQELVNQLQRLLTEAGVEAQVEGRAKHIYSIWRKMQQKQLPLEQVYDARALRVLVPQPADCYQALGVVHGAWRHLSGEFDDYVANPKENGYQSIHTALVGPNERVFEVQIRTADMHAEAEFGVCAHWSYKEPQRRVSDDRIRWLRQLLDGSEAGTAARTGEPDPDDLADALAGGFDADARIFVSTPQGHVLDLPQSATPVDFAYRVHTEIGHRCIGARVDGVAWPLNRPLASGQQVRILTAERARPRFAWLETHQGFVQSNRARQKILQWFRQQHPQSQQRLGEMVWSRECQRLGLPKLASDVGGVLGFADDAELFRRLGAGDLRCVALWRQLDAMPELRERLDWGRQPLCLRVRGVNRDALLRDVTATLSELQINLSGTRAGLADSDRLVEIELDCDTMPVARLSECVARLVEIADVLEVVRLSAA